MVSVEKCNALMTSNLFNGCCTAALVYDVCVHRSVATVCLYAREHDKEICWEGPDDIDDVHLSSPRTPFKYTSITPPLCLFIYLFITLFLIWNSLVKCLFILWRQWWPVFLGKRCATIVTWYYAIVDIVSPFRGNIKDL